MNAPSEQEFAVIVKLKDTVDYSAMHASVAQEERKVRLTRVIQTLRDKAERSQRDIRALLATRETERKAKNVKSFWIFNGFALKAPRETILELAARDDVEEIVPDQVRKLATPLSSSVSIGRWNLDRVNVGFLWDKGFKGAGTVVASIDTGVDLNHPDLKGRWRGGTNSWFDPYSSSHTPYDTEGHGTQTMGVMVGGSTSGVPIGVAPEAQWIAAKVFDDTGNATDSAIHAGFQWALNPDGDPNSADAPDVLNCSWTLEPDPVTYQPPLPIYDEVYRPDIQALKAAGVEVVVAAGNDGPALNKSVSPANYPESLSVGATDISDVIAFFSSRGPNAAPATAFTDMGLPVDTTYPLVTAPGVGIYTANLTSNGLLPNSFTYVDGTSFSAPLVSGVFVLLKSAISGITPSQIEAALKNSVVSAAGPTNTYGYGRIDAGKAFAYLAIPGDVNGDGKVDVVDALIVLKVVAGSIPQNGLITHNGNVSQLVTGIPKPDITIQDAWFVLEKAVGLLNF
jgi:serine protease AprX